MTAFYLRNHLVRKQSVGLVNRYFINVTIKQVLNEFNRCDNSKYNLLTYELKIILIARLIDLTTPISNNVMTT